jgi:hypothetical protein
MFAGGCYSHSAQGGLETPPRPRDGSNRTRLWCCGIALWRTDAECERNFVLRLDSSGQSDGRAGGALPAESQVDAAEARSPCHRIGLGRRGGRAHNLAAPLVPPNHSISLKT